jgi:hypothetical protein
MTLQASGAISLGQIASEFIDTAPHSMSEFRGRNGLPTGAISFSNCYSAQGKYVTYITRGTYTSAGGKYNISSTTAGFDSGICGSSSVATFVHKSGGATNTITLQAIASNVFLSANEKYVEMRGFSGTPTRDSVFYYFTKNGVTYNSTAATFSSNGGAGANTTYRWTFPTTSTFDAASGTATFKLV